MSDIRGPERRKGRRWDALLAACATPLLLQRLSIHPWWASAIAWGAAGGALYYASRWLFDRYHLGRAAKAAIIAVGWFAAILAGVTFEMNAPEQLFPSDRLGRRTVVIPGFESAFTQAAAFSDRSGKAARALSTASQRAFALLVEQQSSEVQVQGRISALSEAQARLEAAAQAHGIFRDFVLANQSAIVGFEGGALMVRIAALCPSEYNQFGAAFSDFLKRARLLDDYTLMNWDALQAGPSGAAAAYDQLFLDLEVARERYNTAFSAHQSCIAAASGNDPELARIFGEIQREIGGQ